MERMGSTAFLVLVGQQAPQVPLALKVLKDLVSLALMVRERRTSGCLS